MSLLRLHQRLAILAVTGTVLLTAGVFVRQAYGEDKHNFERWEKEIAAFEEKDRTKPPPQNGILFAGSSSIRRWNLPKYFSDKDLINRGFGGSEIADSVHFADRIILKAKPRLIVFYAGDNDLANGKSPERVLADFKEFVKLVHAELPRARIAFISIKPSILRWSLIDRIRQANALIEAYCKQHDHLVYIDVVKPMLGEDGKPRPELFVADGLHMNDQGYQLWHSIIAPHLK
jgi:lysophospholipase L1-like esterase